MKDTLLDDLNDAQKMAVTLPSVHALVLAGAGSGKTRVLTTRMAWLLGHAGESPECLLAVTFTNKAAREIQTRLSAMLPFSPRALWSGTFHGLCNRLLRLHYRDAGLPQTFQIFDGADQLSFVKRLMKTLNIDAERFLPREMCRFINQHKEKGERASSVVADNHYAIIKRDFYDEYERACQRDGVVDFAELLLRSFELLTRNESLRAHYQQRFSHILVDEFQDTNRLQYRWLECLAGGGAKIFAVGDDDQSIYRFRGAEVDNMFDFERRFAEQTIRLEQNYRSQGHILDAANALIGHNQTRLGKNLWTAAGKGDLLRLYPAYSDSDEAAQVVDEIRALQDEGSVASQIAVLYRTNALSRNFEHTLFLRNIPYRVYGGLRFFERQEIKHALAYLRLMANTDSDVDFLRVVNFPARGIGARSLENLQAEALQFNSSLYNVAASLSGKAGQNLALFVRLIESLRQDTKHLVLSESILQVIEKSGLKSFYTKEKEGKDRLENLDELINAAAAFSADQEIDKKDDELAAFLAYTALESGENQAADGVEAVQLMSIHAAKGLEFDNVFIVGLEQGLFPHENALEEGDLGMAEERRLMYVAMTRARKRLYLSHADHRLLHGRSQYNVASCFLDEIPTDCLLPLRRLSANSSSAVHASPTLRSQEKRAESVLLPGGFRIGQSVMHPKFGEGVILQAEIESDSVRAEVRFFSSGSSKWLDLNVAKLSAC